MGAHLSLQRLLFLAISSVASVLPKTFFPLQSFPQNHSSVVYPSFTQNVDGTADGAGAA